MTNDGLYQYQQYTIINMYFTITITFYNILQVGILRPTDNECEFDIITVKSLGLIGQGGPQEVGNGTIAALLYIFETYVLKCKSQEDKMVHRRQVILYNCSKILYF